MLTAENGRIYVMFRGSSPYVTAGLHWAEIFRILLYGPFLGIELGPRRRAPIYAGAAIEVSRRLRIVPECVIDLGGGRLPYPSVRTPTPPHLALLFGQSADRRMDGLLFRRMRYVPTRPNSMDSPHLLWYGGSLYSGSGGYYWAGRRLSPDRSGAGLLQVYQGPFA